MFGIYRTLLALVVVFHHCGGYKIGSFAVTSFFTLSGFLMTLLMCETYKKRVGAFAVNRFLRLYPVYWFTMLVMAILVLSGLPVPREDIGIPISEYHLIPDLLFINYWKDNPQLIIPAWAVTNEIVFYILIALGISRTLLRSCIWLGISLITHIVIDSYASPKSDLHYFSPVAASLPFSIGAVAYHLRSKIPVQKVIPVAITTAITMAFCVILYINEVQGLYLEYLFLVSSVLFIISIFHLRKVFPAIQKLDERIGSVSYSIYLNHYGAMMLSMALVGRQNKYLFFVLTLLFSISIAIVTVSLIDKQVNKLRRHFRQVH